MSDKWRKLKKGFTLVELSIVIAVIAILIAVLVPTFTSLITKAKKSNDSVLIANANQTLRLEETLSNKNYTNVTGRHQHACRKRLHGKRT